MSWQKLLAILSAGLGAAAVSIPAGPLAIAIGIAAAASAAGAAAFSHGADKVAATNAAIAGAAAKMVQSLPADHPAAKIVKAIVAADAPPTGA